MLSQTNRDPHRDTHDNKRVRRPLQHRSIAWLHSRPKRLDQMKNKRGKACCGAVTYVQEGDGNAPTRPHDCIQDSLRTTRGSEGLCDLCQQHTAQTTVPRHSEHLHMGKRGRRGGDTAWASEPHAHCSQTRTQANRKRHHPWHDTSKDKGAKSPKTRKAEGHPLPSTAGHEPKGRLGHHLSRPWCRPGLQRRRSRPQGQRSGCHPSGTGGAGSYTYRVGFEKGCQKSLCRAKAHTAWLFIAKNALLQAAQPDNRRYCPPQDGDSVAPLFHPDGGPTAVPQ